MSPNIAIIELVDKYINVNTFIADRIYNKIFKLPERRFYIYVLSVCQFVDLSVKKIESVFKTFIVDIKKIANLGQCHKFAVPL